MEEKRYLIRAAITLIALMCIARFQQMQDYFEASDCDDPLSQDALHQNESDLILHDWKATTSTAQQDNHDLSCDLYNITQKWSLQAKEIVQNLHTFPTPKNSYPFIFFHLRRAGGTSMRHAMNDAVNHQSVPLNKTNIWVPCITRSCRSYSIPVTKDFAMYGGHLYYVDVANKRHVRNIKGVYKTFRQVKEQDEQIEDARPIQSRYFDCLVQFRPTVDRTTSCWNFRLYQDLQSQLPKASHLSADQWDEHLPKAYSRFYEGCNNEVARVFGSYADENLVNTFTPKTLTQDRCPVVTTELDRIMERVSQCVVMISSRCEESKEVLDHYYPWLGKHYACNNTFNVGPKDEKKVLQPGAEQVILKHNAMDEEAYQFAEALFEEQLKVARNSGTEAELAFGKKRKDGRKVKKRNPKRQEQE